ncbi:MAG: hypothetical protein JO041_03075 [Acidobacteria bacterium]|nr:hypothetical protein [Acidobacteriota bacterium]
MRISLIVAAAILFAGCNRIHEDWPVYTGTSADGASAHLVYAGEQTPAGQFQVPSGYAIAGCIEGSNEDFTFTDANTGTIYRLQANYDELKLLTGELVAVQGAVTANQAGVPVLALCSKELDSKGECPSGAGTHPRPIAVSCPATAQGGINEMNQPPATKTGLAQQVAPPNPQNIPGQPALPPEVTRRPGSPH